MDLIFDFDIVGGPFDGAPGMKWLDDGEHPLPELIHVGICGKGAHCGSSACRRSARHVTYWTPDEEERPLGCVGYAKENEFVQRGEDDALTGRAVYAIGGLTDPRSFTATEYAAAGGGPPVVAAAALPRGRHDRGWG